MVLSFRRFVGRVAVATLAVAVPVVMTPLVASADAPTDLFFSEYIEGSSFNKAIEIYNGTGAAVDLSDGGYRLELYSNGSSTVSNSMALSGVLNNGEVFVAAHASANATILAVADAKNSATINWTGDDAIVLRKGGAAGDILDVIGQIGTRPATEWGSGLTSTADNTLRRKAAIIAGDTNGTDAFDPSVEWDGFAADTFDGLGAHPGLVTPPDAGPTVTSVTPASGNAASASVSPTVTFSEPVTLAGAAISLDCSLSGAAAFSVSGGPTVYTIDPVDDLAGACTLTVLASRVSDVDGNDPPDTMAADFSSEFTVAAAPTDPCTTPAVPIGSVQGSGETSPAAGQTRTVRGVVVGDYEGPSPALRGFYLQDPTGDGDPATSDAIFVFNGGNQDLVELGDLVTVTGNVGENQGQTQISVSSLNVAVCGTGTRHPDRRHPADGQRHRLRAVRGHARADGPDAHRHRALPARALR